MAATKKGKEESPLVAHARQELTLLGEDEETIKGYVNVIKAFSEMHHSGTSASIAIPVINALLLFKHITPLTNDPAEWMDVSSYTPTSPALWQSKRNPEAFSSDGGKTYYLLSEGAHQHNQRPLHTAITKEK